MALSLPYAAAARPDLAVPTPVVSVATTPVLDTKFDIETGMVPSYPNPKIAFWVTIAAEVVMELLAALATLVPIALVAVTVNVYDVEEARPLTVMVPEPA